VLVAGSNGNCKRERDSIDRFPESLENKRSIERLEMASLMVDGF
jgi:hypothetical protein